MLARLCLVTGILGVFLRILFTDFNFKKMLSVVPYLNVSFLYCFLPNYFVISV